MIAEKTYISYNDIRQKLIGLGQYFYHYHSRPYTIYGVPRGGNIVAGILSGMTFDCSLTDDPSMADFIIDDLIDSGATKQRYNSLYPDIPFVALYDKLESPELKNKWLVFPWEVKETDEKSETIEDNVRRILQFVGEDVTRNGLLDTPKRYAKFMQEFLSPDPFKFTAFPSEGYDEMIVVKKIPFYSLCEHHIAPFFGYAHVGYIPDKNIVGLSKIPRLVDKISRRLQNQERITTNIAYELQEVLEPIGVGVVLEARHMCMEMRGVKKTHPQTTTSKLLGAFQKPEVRSEFFQLINK